MTRLLRTHGCLLSLVLAACAMAADSDQMAKLDDALTAVVGFEHGANSGPLIFVEQFVFEVVTDPTKREAVETRLLRALDKSRTRDARIFLCRQMRTIGTDRAVPHLEKWLTDPEVSHAARYALGSMGTDAAMAAMLRALPKAAAPQQVGIINTLGLKRYDRAVSDTAGLLSSSDPAVVEAAARALGRIGNDAAARALRSARAEASGPMQRCMDRALLVCAERLAADGDNRRAERIYQWFYSPDQPGHIRLAALRGLIITQGPRGAGLLTEALQGTDPDLRRGAISLISIVPGAEATKVFAELLPSLPADIQELMLYALGDRGDSATAPAIAKATESENEQVRVAAIEALGKVGDASSAAVLARAAAAATGAGRLIARASLVRLKGPEVNDALMQLAVSGEPRVRTEAIRALADREATQAVAKLFQAARADDGDVRTEAIRALGRLTDESDLNSLLALAIRPKDSEDRPAIEQAIAAVFARIDDKDRQAGPVLSALDRAPADAKPTLLKLLSRPGTKPALAAVRAGLNDPDANIRDAAVRALSDWPTPEPVADLLDLVRDSQDRTHKVLALRGYVRLAGQSDDPTAMYVRAMDLATRPEDKKLVLAGLGTADSAQALTLVEGYLSNEELRAEAALAVVQIADRLRQTEPTQAKAALRNVIPIIADGPTRDKARAIINEMEQYEGYILVWLVSGPCAEKDKEGPQLFDVAFPAEKNGSSQAEWKPLTAGIGAWDINLESTFGSKDHCAAYVRTTIVSPSDQDVRLELSSDDSIKAWLNGELIHGTNTSRGMAPRQDMVDTKLRKGRNDLKLKVIDNAGGWAFACRVRSRDGSALDGLKIEAK